MVETVTPKRTLTFFYPLALSWVCMALEGPISVSAISRLPNATINTAAFQVLMAIALLIESPVIDLLSTSTALAANRSAFLRLRKFVLILGIALTALHVGLVFTPALNLFTVRVLAIPSDVALAAGSGLQWMVLWSAAIGWRRFNQGLLIRNGLTRWVGVGTLVRLGTLMASVSLLPLAGRWTGIEVVGIALVLSVCMEASFSQWAVQRVMKRLLTEPSDSAAPLTWAQLCRFHFPLSATTLIMLGSQPAISFALARSPDSVIALAGFQVAQSIGWLLRATVYALPEVVITLGRVPGALPVLRNFCLHAGLISSGVLVGFVLTGAAPLLFANWMGAEEEVVVAATTALAWTAGMPLIGALQAYCRGVLTIHHQTTTRLIAMVGGIAVLLSSLGLGIFYRMPGVINANFSQTLAQTVELGLLYVLMRKAIAQAHTVTE